MILVDTSIWIDHLRSGDETLVHLLHDGGVMVHPFVIGELALGNLRQRERVLSELLDLPQARVAMDREVLQYIGHHKLFGLGVGYVDAHLLVAVSLTLGASLWTRDSRLRAVAEQLNLATQFVR
jgi:predicted nucleic acid-binding protein